MRFLPVARRYRELGYHPIPCEPRGKRPLVQWKRYQEMPPTDDELQAWAAATPDANVGLVMGRGMFAVDLDGDVTSALDGLPFEFEYSEVPRSRTGHGIHLLFAGQARDAVSLLEGDGWKVDIRGVGFIVAPPSIHPSGKVYEWLVPPAGPPPPAPAGLLQLVASGILDANPDSVQIPGQFRAPESPAWVSELMAGAPEGQRDASCTRLAGYYLGLGMAPDVVAAILVPWGARCAPHFPAAEVWKCVESIAAREAAAQPAPVGDGDLLDIGAACDLVITDLAAGPTKFVELPYGQFNALLGGGLAPSEYMVLGARPGVGKTAMACEIIERAGRDGHRTLMVSREMPVRAIMRRVLSRHTGILAQTIRAGKASREEVGRIAKVRDQLARLPIVITSAVKSIEQLQQVAAERGPWGLIVVDYLQMLNSTTAEGERRQEVEYMSRAMKDIAKDHSVPLVVLAALRRFGDREQARQPTMHDLKEAGGIESDADVVMLLWRPDPQNPGLVECVIDKARDGATGRWTMGYEGEHYRFRPDLRGPF